MYATDNPRLAKIYAEFDDCEICERLKNPLQHILGVGDTLRPKSALILINPTDHNISSDPAWELYRFPFIGVRHFWKVLEGAGIISENLLARIYENRWDQRVLEQINEELSKAGVYLTNLVKCCRDNPSYPPKDLIAGQSRLLIEELNVLKPKNIICFGLLPLRVMTGRSVKLADYVKRLSSNRVLGFDPVFPLNFKTKIYPCYFPAGRGNPKMSIKLLKIYRKLLS